MGTLKELCTIRTASFVYHPQATEVVSRVHIADLLTATNPSVLRALKITHVVSAMPGDVDLPPWDSSKLLQIAVEDMPFVEIVAHLDRAARWITKALDSSPDNRVLVHCFQGVSRSSTVVCAYLIYSRKWSASQALAHIKSMRTVAEPNFGFVAQLREYEELLFCRNNRHR